MAHGSVDEGIIDEIEKNTPNLRQHIDRDKLFRYLVQHTNGHTGGKPTHQNSIDFKHPQKFEKNQQNSIVEIVEPRSQRHKDSHTQNNIQIDIVVRVSIDHSLPVQDYSTLCYVPRVELDKNVHT